MKAGGLEEQAIHQVCNINGSVEEGQNNSPVIKVFVTSPLPFILGP